MLPRQPRGGAGRGGAHSSPAPPRRRSLENGGPAAPAEWAWEEVRGSPPPGGSVPVCPLGERSVCAALHGVRLSSAGPSPHLGGAAGAGRGQSGRFSVLAGLFPGGGAQTPISFLLGLAGSIQLGRRLFPLASETPAPAYTSLRLQAPRCAQAPAAAWAAPGRRAGWRRAWSSGPVPATAFTG